MTVGPKDRWQIVADALQQMKDQVAEAQERERARRAAQTPQQRRAEEEQERRAQEHRQKQRAAAEAARVRRSVEKAAAPYRKYESFTLVEFACLLHGHSPPGRVDRWTGFGPHEEDAAVVNTRCVLGSAVRHTAESIPSMPLYPVNPGAPEKEHRFPRGALLDIARAKALGYADMLSAVLTGARQTTLAAPSVPPKVQRSIAEPTALAAARSPAVAQAPGKRPWQRQADALMADVIAALRGLAEGERRSYEAVCAEFGRRCSVKALHEELKLGRGVPKGEEPQGIGLDSFRRYLLAHHRGFEFAGGRPTGDRDFLKALLED